MAAKITLRRNHPVEDDWNLLIDGLVELESYPHTYLQTLKAYLLNETPGIGKPEILDMANEIKAEYPEGFEDGEINP